MSEYTRGPWTVENCPDHHYRAMGMCPYCGDTLEAAWIRNADVFSRALNKISGNDPVSLARLRELDEYPDQEERE